MDIVPDMLSMHPECWSLIGLGTLVGVVWGLYEDWQKDEDIPTSWWQYSGIGALVGLVACLALAGDL